MESYSHLLGTHCRGYTHGKLHGTFFPCPAPEERSCGERERAHCAPLEGNFDIPTRGSCLRLTGHSKAQYVAVPEKHSVLIYSYSESIYRNKCRGLVRCYPQFPCRPENINPSQCITTTIREAVFFPVAQGAYASSRFLLGPSAHFIKPAIYAVPLVCLALRINPSFAQAPYFTAYVEVNDNTPDWVVEPREGNS
ncbi:hypothetical protein VTN00DRAFT_5451 [Thermoascus crustaceus]|uniref:uncharacterized protein n=1 Tax=Thermoascus crustaceus TaxID=5088 RepID=UPI003742B5BE